MIVDKLYSKILLEPRKRGANTLYAVSGYASATFANRHLNDFGSLNLRLIIGMPGSVNDHLGYIRLYERYNERFEGYYLLNSPFVHSKMYAWYEENRSILGYAGSANYSQLGFNDTLQLNQFSNENPEEILNYFNLLLPRCVRIKDYEPEAIIPPEKINPLENISDSVVPGSIEWEIIDKRVRISFLAKDGSLPMRSGLNWGQRPEYGRNPNQAYLGLRKESRNIGFLPAIGQTFTLITDDNQSIDCCVAQQGRKAIHSTFDNSEMGLYIRNRLGLESGVPVTLDDLVNYGRTDYTLEKIDEETFLFDFSVKN